MGRVKADVNEQTDLHILQILSMNGRATLDFIGTQVKLRKHPVYRRIKLLEEKYGIRYLAEIDIEKLGYSGYIAFVKFRNKIPDMRHIRSALEKEPHVQLVLLTTGKYDLIIYLVSQSHKEMSYLIYKLRTETSFADYPADWYFTPYFTQNDIPIRNEFFQLLEKKIWRRTKDKKRPESNDIVEREFILLKELSKDGSMNFTELDKICGFKQGASRYPYYKLRMQGILKRITISMDKLPIKYNAIFLLNDYYGKKSVRSRFNLLKELIMDGPIINKYVQNNEIGAPAGALLIMPIFNDSDLKLTEDELKRKAWGIDIERFIVNEIVVGSLIYRRFDRTYTSQYRLLTEEYKLLKPEKKIQYDEITKRNSNVHEFINLPANTKSKSNTYDI